MLHSAFTPAACGRRVYPHRRPQSGQIAPVMIVALLAICVIGIVTYNASRSTIAKMELVNAADAAAYSGGIQAAQSMNFMAYTNRAMVANTISAGYVVAYISQLRYQAQLTQKLSKPKRLLGQIAAIIADGTARQFDSFASYDYAETSEQIDREYDQARQRQQHESDAEYQARLSTLDDQRRIAKEGVQQDMSPDGSHALLSRRYDARAAAIAEYDQAMRDIDERYNRDRQALENDHSERARRRLEQLEQERWQAREDAADRINERYQRGQTPTADAARLGGGDGGQEGAGRAPAGSSKFAKAGRAGGAMADALFKAIGFATIPYIDSINMAYAGIQFAEWTQVKGAIEATIADTARIYGQDIRADWVFDDTFEEFASFGWMMPVRPGIDGISARYNKEIGLKLRNLYQRYGGAGGSAGSGLLNLLFGQVLGIFDRNKLNGASGNGYTLSPMHAFINNEMTFEDARYMVFDRSSRYTMQQVFGLWSPPIPSINFNYRLGDMVYDMTPSSFAPFLGFAGSGFGSLAIDLSGTSDFTQNFQPAPTPQDQDESQPLLPGGADSHLSASGTNQTPSLAPRLPQTAISNVTGSLAAPTEEQINQRVQASVERDRQSRGRWGRMGQQTEQAFNAFRSRLDHLSQDFHQQNRHLQDRLAGTPAAGADWSSTDELRMGMWIWDLKWKLGWFPLDFVETLMATGYHLNKGAEGSGVDLNLIAGAEASAKEFWPTYQGVPLYMALSELPWTDGVLNVTGAQSDQRRIKVEARRPVPAPLVSLTSLVPDQHAQGEQRLQMSARAQAEVFYFRQPNDRGYGPGNASDLTGEHASFQYFFSRSHVNNPTPSPMASFLMDTQVDPTEWFAHLKNWYGDKWAKRMVKVNNIYLRGLKPNVGVSRELPSLMTPFWDARLVRF